MQPRHFRARQKSSDIRRISTSNDQLNANNGEQKHPIDAVSTSTASTAFVENDDDNKVNIKKIFTHTSSDLVFDHIKKEHFEEDTCKMETLADLAIRDQSNHSESTEASAVKRRKSDDGGSICSSMMDAPSETNDTITSQLPRKKNALRTQLAQQILSSSSKPLKKPLYVVRPANVSSQSSSQSNGNLALDSTVLHNVFRYLSPDMLVTCSMVCKSWSNASVDPRLWKTMLCSHHKLSASLLMAIVRRQPEQLYLDWTSIAKQQLTWLISRLPALKYLSLQGTQISAALGLHTCLCPPLQTLDLSFVRCLNDSAIRDILSPPKDSRPGLTDSKSRLRNLKVLKLAGTDISDVALRYITQGVPSLIHLNISSCQRVTDAGVAQIGTCQSAINTLVELDLSSCKLVTELCLEYLTKCEALTYLDLRHVPQVSTQSVIKFAAKSKHNLHVRDIKLVDKRK